MYPCKSIMDYMAEVERLFPPASENERLQTSPFSQSTMANHSSSSAEPMIPESFHDMSLPIGRTNLENPYDFRVIKPPSKHVHPSNVNNNYKEHNTSYKLFPMETKGYEFQIPITGSANTNISPNPSNASPNMFISSPNSLGPWASIQPKSSPNLASPTQFYLKQPSTYGPSSSNQGGSIKMCTFCVKNGETPMWYMTHNLKQKIGDKKIVTCPILRSLVCAICGVSGDYAHTKSYCPVVCRNNRGRPLDSAGNTRRKGNGRRRY